MTKKTIEDEIEIPEPENTKGLKPDFRIVQAERGPDGETKFRNIGGMWRKTSKSGNEFYSLSIGNLKLLVFPNKKAE